jgi:hypothetical protein
MEFSPRRRVVAGGNGSPFMGERLPGASLPTRIALPIEAPAPY